MFPTDTSLRTDKDASSTHSSPLFPFLRLPGKKAWKRVTLFPCITPVCRISSTGVWPTWPSRSVLRGQVSATPRCA